MKGGLFLLCGLVGGIVGALVMHALDDEAAPRAARGSERAEDPGLRADVDALRTQIEELRRRARFDAAGDAPPRDGGGDSDAAGDAPAPVKTDAPPREDPLAVDDDGVPKHPAGVVRYVLEAKEYGPTEANRLFAWMTGNPRRIPAVIAKLEAEVEKNPESADLQAALATAYVGELSNNTQPGPQQGLVWGKASAAYDQAIKLDPEHWQARFGKAIGTTFIPVQFGMRPAAIKQFEDLRKIQESQAPRTHHAQTYTQLSQLYAEAGNAGKARTVLNDGLRLFPDNQQIKAQLAVLEKR